MIKDIIENESDEDLKQVCSKIITGKRINKEEAEILLNRASLNLLGALADNIRKLKNGKNVYYIKNYHIEPTNICVYNCKFCSYRKKKNDPDAWKLGKDEILKIVSGNKKFNPEEVHIVGACHPDWDVFFYAGLLNEIRSIDKKIHLKAFSAVELKYMFELAGKNIDEGLEILKGAGLQSIPGGGAEIFDETLRQDICNEKVNSAEWLEIHKKAHQKGLKSNATILYGHKENYNHRIDHLERLRYLQDETNGFNAFIPLKFRNKNNQMSNIKEVSIIEDLKFFAFSRIYLDNFPHIKAYWPMLGIENSLLTMHYGADDLDGTIEDSTKIYTMAGVKQKASYNDSEIKNLVENYKLTPVERDSYYNYIE